MNDSNKYLKKIEIIMTDLSYNCDTLKATIELLLKAWDHSKSYERHKNIQKHLQKRYKRVSKCAPHGILYDKINMGMDDGVVYGKQDT